MLGANEIRDLLTNDRGDWVADRYALYERQGDVLAKVQSMGMSGCLRDVTPDGAWAHCTTRAVRLMDPGGVELARYSLRDDADAAQVSGDATQLALLLSDFTDHHPRQDILSVTLTTGEHGELEEIVE